MTFPIFNLYIIQVAPNRFEFLSERSYYFVFFSNYETFSFSIFSNGNMKLKPISNLQCRVNFNVGWLNKD